MPTTTKHESVYTCLKSKRASCEWQQVFVFVFESHDSNKRTENFFSCGIRGFPQILKSGSRPMDPKKSPNKLYPVLHFLSQPTNKKCENKKSSKSVNCDATHSQSKSNDDYIFWKNKHAPLPCFAHPLHPPFLPLRCRCRADNHKQAKQALPSQKNEKLN